jgi:hypothetical protein
VIYINIHQYVQQLFIILFQNLKKTSAAQLARRLGRLAWKSVNAVVSFTKQNRMKDDKEYATAVTHLRTRECTTTDIDLFNTRVLKSACYENGIDMSIEDFTVPHRFHLDSTTPHGVQVEYTWTFLAGHPPKFCIKSTWTPLI